jgi:hypothetical protein
MLTWLLKMFLVCTDQSIVNALSSEFWCHDGDRSRGVQITCFHQHFHYPDPNFCNWAQWRIQISEFWQIVNLLSLSTLHSLAEVRTLGSGTSFPQIQLSPIILGIYAYHLWPLSKFQTRNYYPAQAQNFFTFKMRKPSLKHRQHVSNKSHF